MFRTHTWRPRGLRKWGISRVVSTLSGDALIITLLITDLLSPLGLQVGEATIPSMFVLWMSSFGRLELWGGWVRE